MKNVSTRCVLFLSMFALVSLFVVGCKSGTPDAKPGQDLNPAMSAQQKAVIQNRKKDETGGN